VNAASGNIAHLFSGPIPEQTLPLKYVLCLRCRLIDFFVNMHVYQYTDSSAF
jgi:hypothetical protein